MTPEVIVISLPDAKERRASVERQLSDLGVTYRFFDAVRGVEGHELFSKYDARSRLREEVEDMSSGQLGCYASHYLVWQQCVRANKSLIVLEDDVLIDQKRFGDFLKGSSGIPDRYECVRLFPPLSRKNRPWLKCCSVDGGLAIYKFKKGHKSTTGYLIRPSGAAKLLGHAKKWIQPVDIEMDQFWIHGVESYGVWPTCLKNDPRFESMIGYEDSRPERSLNITLYRKLNQMKDLWMRSLHNLSFRMGRLL